MKNYLCRIIATWFIILLCSPGNLFAQPNHLVISQVYAGAGCTTPGCSIYQNDFIEIFNPTGTPVNLNGWSVQYAEFSGTTWQITPLTNFTLQPGQYYLIGQAFNTNGTNALPLPDATGTLNLSESMGRVALLNSTTVLNGSCPGSASIVDLLGYGSVNCRETSRASDPGLTMSLTRKSGGCRDTDNNAADFDLLPPAPRNKNSALNVCPVFTISINDVSVAEGNGGTTLFNFTVSLSAPAPDGGIAFSIATADHTATIANNDYVARSLTAQSIASGGSSYTFTVNVNGDALIEPTESFYVNLSNVVGATIADGQGLGTIVSDDFAGTTIAMVQGNGNSSPLAGQVVTIQGIVTGIRSNGFFLQTPDARTDSDPATSEGIFVFTSSTPAASVVRGNELLVTGTVLEFIPSSDANSQPLTEIISPIISLISTGNALPTPIVLNSADLITNNLNNLERYEGMRVQVNSLTCTAPTAGTINEATATATSNGYFYGVITGTPRPFREAGVQLPDVLPAGAPANVPRWDANPEILGIDTRAQTGSVALNVATGAVLTSITGPLDYTRRYYTIIMDPAPLPAISNNNPTFTMVPAAKSGEVSIASMNMQRFFDNVNDPAITELVLSTTAYNNRLNKASLAVRNVLNYPDVIGVAEVENLATLQAIATKINTDATAAAQPDPMYQAYLVEGNDFGGIDVGFLVKSSTISTLSVTQFGKSDTYVNPNDGLPETTFDRPPLVLQANTIKAGCTTPTSFTVVMNHLRSLNGIADATEGPRVRAKRIAQAEYLANFLQSRQSTNPSEKILCLGDFNAYPFNDGYVDVVGTIKGTPAPADQVVAASAKLVNPNLINLMDSLSAKERYTYLFSGSAQVLDHILVTESFKSQVSGYAVARLGADFPQIFFGESNRPERLTDHDVPVAFFNFLCTKPSTATDYFRTHTSGNWNSIATWESSPDNISWHAATLTPDFNANAITIQNGNSVVVSTPVTVNKLTIRPGGSVLVDSGIKFTVE